MFIRGVVTAFPKHKVDNGTISTWCNSDAKFLSEKIGVRHRFLLDNNENEITLSHEACSNLFSNFPALNPGKIKIIIYVGQAKTVVIPHISAILHQKLSLSLNCAAFDIGLACSGYVYALSIAKALMKTYDICDALIVTCDPYSLIMGKTNRDTVPLFGDAASASWISSTGPGIKIGEFDLGTDGSKSGFLECKVNSELTMNGRGIFNFAMQRIPDSIHRCLELNKKRIKEIDYLLLHQANKFILEQVVSKLGIEKAKCPIYMQHTSNTVSSSIPILIEKFMPHFSSGQSMVMSGFGAGLSWGTVYGVYSGGGHD